MKRGEEMGKMEEEKWEIKAFHYGNISHGNIKNSIGNILNDIVNNIVL